MDGSTTLIRFRYLLIAIASALAAAALIFAGGALRHSAATAATAAAASEPAAQLNVTRSIELTSEKATRARNAIKHGDYADAAKIVAGVLAGSHLQNWRFYPFADFMNHITDVSDPAFAANLDAWVAQSNNDAIPLLVRAKYLHDAGWFKRGERFGAQTRPAAMVSFRDYMSRALADIDAAIGLNDGNPYGFYLKLRILHGSGASDAMAEAFEQAVAKYPAYYPLYDIMIETLAPKWGGSVPMMYALVDHYAGGVDEHSPLKILYLTLYRDLLNAASVACTPNWRDREVMAQCVAAGMEKMVTPRLDSQVLAALQLFDHTDKYQFGLVVEAILFDMLKTAGGDAYAGIILQLAASSMHSDTQLKEEKPGNNDYVIDKAVAESWYVKGFYDNALKKDQEALKDVEATAFPGEEEKDLAVAGIYDYIGGTYNKLNQYADMIAYEKAAVALGDRTDGEHFTCYGYYRLKDYDAAVQWCTKTLEDQSNNMQARYWRGRAYGDSGRTDAAAADLTAVAESEDNFRTSAAIDLSMIYFNRNDDRGALDMLNKYTYLYDPSTQSKSDMAVSYNNRCYAYMQLGELRKALDDCTASLRYGSLPDAIRKQQELIARLGVQEERL
jgi:tetratricopeptide (TPR) repeat protein